MRPVRIILLLMVTLWLITTGCSEKLPILYSPLKDDYQLSPGFTDREQGKKQLDEFFEEDQRLYRNLSRLTTVIDDAEDDPGDEAEIHSYPEAHNGILEGLTATEWFTAGRQAASDRRWDDALNAFNKAIALNPENEEIYFHRGNVYDALGNNKKAVSNFNKAIKLNPLYVDAYLSRAFSYNNLAQANQALADIKKAARLGSLHAQKFLKKSNLAW